jgi:oxygen-dependent protoporphyrinogen oxidase
MARVAVVGGGIAGLTAALTLQERNHDVTLFEASDRLGGKLHTDRPDGLLIDTGPDSFLSSKPAALQLVEQIGLTPSVINTLPDGGGTFILRRGKLMPLPEGITLLVPAEARAIARTPLLSPLGKIRMALDYVIPARKDEADEAVGAFVRRRVGREAFERMAEPLLSGIFAGDADRLSLLSTFPRLRETERKHGSVIKGAIAQRRQMRGATPPSGPRRTPFVSLTGGLSELIDGIAARLERTNILTTSSVTAVELHDAGVTLAANGVSANFDGVVFATPAWATAALLTDSDAELGKLLNGIEYVSSATVSLAFRDADVAGKQGGRGFVIPRAEGRTLTAVTWTSSKFGGRVPEGTVLLRGFVGRAGNEEPAFLPEDELLSVVLHELRDILGIHAEPTLTRVYRWHRALPQYNLGHPERLTEIDLRLTHHPSIALTGAAYRGVGIPDCITDATTQANALADRIDRRIG